MESPTTKTMQDVEAPTLKMWLERKHSSLMCENPQSMPPSTFRMPGCCRCPPLTRRACPRRQGRKWSCTALWVCAQRKRGRSCSTPVLRPSTISVEEYKHGRMPGTPRHVASGHH